MRIFITSLLLVAGSVVALDNIPDNEIAACKVKSNDFTFLCHLNTKNYHSCKFMIGATFDLPKCEPYTEKKEIPVVVIEQKQEPYNPFLDAFRIKK